MGRWGIRLEEGTGLWDLLYVYPEPRRIEWGGQGVDFILMSGPTSDLNSLCDPGHVLCSLGLSVHICEMGIIDDAFPTLKQP